VSGLLNHPIDLKAEKKNTNKVALDDVREDDIKPKS
jgi:hypothetical protein